MLIRILDQELKLTFGDPGIIEDKAMGRCNVAKSSIWINEQLDDDVLGSTLVHEVVHAIAELQGIDITEQDVCGLERGFYSFLVNNQDLIFKIVGREPLRD